MLSRSAPRAIAYPFIFLVLGCDEGLKIVQTSQGDIAVPGNARLVGDQRKDIRLIRLDNGCETFSGTSVRVLKAKTQTLDGVQKQFVQIEGVPGCPRGWVEADLIVPDVAKPGPR